MNKIVLNAFVGVNKYVKTLIINKKDILKTKKITLKQIKSPKYTLLQDKTVLNLYNNFDETHFELTR